jgi:hypothetical protein
MSTPIPPGPGRSSGPLPVQHGQPGSGNGLRRRPAPARWPRRPPIWYGGGKLAADLALPKLRTRWAVGDPAGLHRPGQDAPLVRRRTPAQHAGPAPVARELGTRLWGSGVFQRVPVHWAGARRDLTSRGLASRQSGRTPALQHRHRSRPRSGPSLGRGGRAPHCRQGDRQPGIALCCGHYDRASRRLPRGRRAASRVSHRCPGTRDSVRPDASQICPARSSR